MLKEGITPEYKTQKTIETARRLGFMKGFSTCLIVLFILVSTCYSLKVIFSEPKTSCEKVNLD